MTFLLYNIIHQIIQPILPFIQNRWFLFGGLRFWLRFRRRIRHRHRFRLWGRLHLKLYFLLRDH